MSFAKAFEKASAKKGEKIDMPQQAQSVETDPERVPMMYRAQISGRCSLMFAGENNHDLNDWTKEWVFPMENGEPHYQHEQPKLGLDGSVYRFEIEFPFRVCSNCGQDSILRPVIGKHGIPFIPGSSIKGIFRRLLFSNEISAEKKQKVAKYSGNEEHPGILRFHGAYLVGDWAGAEKVTDKIRYRMVDVIHPQEKPQVQGKGSATALAIVSFYQPKMVFEISCIEPLNETEWESVKGLLRIALRLGLGGKTSTGYGLWVFPKNTYPLSVTLKGVGVSSLLRSGQPEFRPNLFKANLRGHVSRLLAGVCSTETIIEARVKQIFGSTKAPSKVQIYWETKKSSNKPILEYDIQGTEGTPIYKIEGNLYVDAPKQDLKFLALVLQFAYIMGGFGKSWRRVWHKCSIKGWHPGFFSNYQTRAIGCHWEGDFIESKDFEPIQIANSDDLAKFLSELHNECRKYMKVQQAQFCDWKEAWHPDRVLVYSNVVSQSKIVNLFHKEQFKTVTAVGGRKKIKNTGEVEKEVLVHSSVWHRMLPLSNNQYLEIVTVFHGDRTPWNNQLKPITDAIKSALKTTTPTWGKEPNL